jgi:hypothetical protein
MNMSCEAVHAIAGMAFCGSDTLSDISLPRTLVCSVLMAASRRTDVLCSLDALRPTLAAAGALRAHSGRCATGSVVDGTGLESKG